MSKKYLRATDYTAAKLLSRVLTDLKERGVEYEMISYASVDACKRDIEEEPSLIDAPESYIKLKIRNMLVYVETSYF